MIICFSGTGNTAMVARELSRRLHDPDILMLERDALRSPAAIHAAGAAVVWAFPIYSWGVPPVVAKYMRKARVEGAACHHLVCTCGDDIGLAHRQWRALVESRGWKAGRAFSVQMPNNYVLMKGFDVDTPDVARRKLDAMPARVARMAEALTRYAAQPDLPVADDVVQGKFAWIKSRIIYPWFVRFDMSPRPFHATAACVGCGKCATSCPLANIEMDADRRPCWGTDCALCLRCYHVCPVHAVAYGRVTAIKGQKPVYTVFGNE